MKALRRFSRWVLSLFSMECHNEGAEPMGITADKIKTMRRAAGQTQQQLAARLNVSRSLIAMIETGKRKVPPKLTAAIAQIVKEESACE
jgi:DNA-binding XRE family transcriptional regulator